jgi:hypothetical protein
MKSSSETITNENSRPSDVKQSIKSLETAEQTFESISKMPTEEVQPYRYMSRTQCSELSRQCADVLRQSEEFLARAEKVQIEDLKNQEALEMDRLRVLAQNKMIALKRAEEEAIRLEELKLKRRFFMQHNRDALVAREIKDEPKSRSSGAVSGKKRRRQNDRKMDESDGFINDSDENDKVRRKKNKVLFKFNTLNQILGTG